MIKLSHHNPNSTLFDLMPDLTPMLDILFILLVFFLLTAGTVYKALDLNLPSSVTEELSISNTPKHIMLEIRDNAYAIDSKTIMSFEELRAEITNAIKNKPGYEVIIAGDKTISIEKLLNVLTYLQSQGIQAANILMKNEKNQ